MLRSGLVNLLIRLSSATILLLLNVAIARLLGPEAFGGYTYVVSVLQIASYVVQWGFPSSLTKFVTHHAHSERWSDLPDVIYSSTFLMFIITVALALPLGLYWTVVSPPRGGMTVVAPSLILIFAMSMSPVLASVLQGLGALSSSQLADQIVKPTFFLLLFLGAFSVGREATIAETLWAQVFGVLVADIFAIYLITRKLSLPLVSPSLTRALYWGRKSFPFFALTIIQGFGAPAVILLLGHLISDVELAHFRVAIQVSDALNMLLFGISVIISPKIVQLAMDENWDEMESYVVTSHIAGFAIMIIPVILLVIWMDQILPLVFGQNFAQASDAAKVMVAGKLIYSIVGFSGAVLCMSGYVRTAGVISFVNLLVSLLAIWIFVPIFGLIAAAVVVTIANVMVNAVGHYWIHRLTGRNMSAFNVRALRRGVWRSVVR